jgi:arginine:ornithine antiporter/lysine permease
MVQNNTNVKELTFFAMFSLIFGSMMGSGVFDIPQNIAHKAGLIAVIISWVITAIGMLSLGFALSYLTIKKPEIQSGIYGYAKYGFNDYIGFNSAWGYWLNALLGNASYVIYIFATLSNFTTFNFFHNGVNIFSLIAESILIWLIYFLIIRGIKEASIVNIMVSIIKILALFVIIIIFIFAFKINQFKINLSEVPSFSELLVQIKSTMLVTVWDFLGIEAACIYAVRAKNMKDVARATMYGVSIVLIIDILISILPFGIINSSVVSNLHTPSTAGILSIIAGNFSSNLISIAVIVSVTGALLAWSMLATNIIYLSAEDNTMPKFLTKLNKQLVPANSALVSILTLQLFILFAYFTDSVYLVMIQLATSLILIPYLLVGIYAFKLLIQEKVVHYFNILKGFIAVLYGVWLIYAGGLKYLLFSSMLYALGFIVYAYSRREQQKSIFNTKFELVLCTLLILLAIFVLILWQLKIITL